MATGVRRAARPGLVRGDYLAALGVCGVAVGVAIWSYVSQIHPKLNGRHDPQIIGALILLALTVAMVFSIRDLLLLRRSDDYLQDIKKATSENISEMCLNFDNEELIANRFLQVVWEKTRSENPKEKHEPDILPKTAELTQSLHEEVNVPLWLRWSISSTVLLGLTGTLWSLGQSLAAIDPVKLKLDAAQTVLETVLPLLGFTFYGSFVGVIASIGLSLLRICHENQLNEHLSAIETTLDRLMPTVFYINWKPASQRLQGAAIDLSMAVKVIGQISANLNSYITDSAENLNSAMKKIADAAGKMDASVDSTSSNLERVSTRLLDATGQINGILSSVDSKTKIIIQKNSEEIKTDIKGLQEAIPGVIDKSIAAHVQSWLSQVENHEKGFINLLKEQHQSHSAKIKDLDDKTTGWLRAAQKTSEVSQESSDLLARLSKRNLEIEELNRALRESFDQFRGVLVTERKTLSEMQASFNERTENSLKHLESNSKEAATKLTEAAEQQKNAAISLNKLRKILSNVVQGAEKMIVSLSENANQQTIVTDSLALSSRNMKQSAEYLQNASQRLPETTAGTQSAIELVLQLQSGLKTQMQSILAIFEETKGAFVGYQTGLRTANTQLQTLVNDDQKMIRQIFAALDIPLDEKESAAPSPDTAQAAIGNDAAVNGASPQQGESQPDADASQTG